MIKFHEILNTMTNSVSPRNSQRICCILETMSIKKQLQRWIQTDFKAYQGIFSKADKWRKKYNISLKERRVKLKSCFVD